MQKNKVVFDDNTPDEEVINYLLTRVIKRKIAVEREFTKEKEYELNSFETLHINIYEDDFYLLDAILAYGSKYEKTKEYADNFIRIKRNILKLKEESYNRLKSLIDEFIKFLVANKYITKLDK